MTAKTLRGRTARLERAPIHGQFVLFGARTLSHDSLHIIIIITQKQQQQQQH